MSSEDHFSQVLREWSQVFMQRSVTEFKRFMDQSGLSATQIHALMRLYHSTDQDRVENPGNCNVSELGNHLGITNAASSQLVDRLVQLDLIQRRENPIDRRVKHVALTPKGKALIEEGVDSRQKWIEKLTIALTPEEQSAIIHALPLLTQAARDLQPSELHK